MQYRTHLATTLAVSLPIMTNTGNVNVVSVIALGLGAMFPDIDEPHSWIGSRTRGLSDVIKLFFGHRGITHSLFGLFLAFMTVILLITLTPFKIMTGVFFLIGYALHLIEDSFSKSGVKWFIPFTDKAYQSGKGIVYYKTGGLIENLIFLITVFVLVMQIKALDFNAVAMPELNVIETVSEWVQKIITVISG